MCIRDSPGRVPLHKVNWKAKFEYEFVYNFKILQQSFTKCNIPKYIDVERLIKAKYQDNLEFAQWMRKYFDANYSQREYDAVARRNTTETDFTFIDKIGSKSSVNKESVTKSSSQSVMNTSKGSISKGMIPIPKSFLMRGDTREGGSTLAKTNSSSSLGISVANKENDILNIVNPGDKHRFERNCQYDLLKSERDFFYSKLRDIDHMLDVFKEKDVDKLTQCIRDILYLTPERIAIVMEDGTLKIQTKSSDDDSSQSLSMINANVSLDSMDGMAGSARGGLANMNNSHGSNGFGPSSSMEEKMIPTTYNNQEGLP
eukprot:TRINITY_DN28125_c0_g1_i1.p1 TRINITY_DN28125_c0_g1~~TRINITY_DN28125_c0_g1_i1.p1  ORF type:complete len:328 (-),score=76.12 TRINITY_DN28125_c0_g1_i1:53-997(-)